MRWWKQLSQSDAQQETEGGLMPFRFTRENCPGDFITWFRNEFFNNLEWKNTTWRHRPLEEADVTISVNIRGENMGQMAMRATHAEYRHENHNAPTTYLHFDLETSEYLQSHNMTDKYIIFQKELNGSFKLIVQDNIPQ